MNQSQQIMKSLGEAGNVGEEEVNKAMKAKGFEEGTDFIVDDDDHLSVFRIKGNKELLKRFPLKSTKDIDKAIAWLEAGKK